MTRRQQLESILASLKGGIEPEHSQESKLGDFGDEALKLSGQAVTEELSRNRVRSIRLIMAALRRYEENPASPDLCEDCDEAIGAKRLSALPWATKCLECQAREERGARDVGEAKRLKEWYQSDQNSNDKFFNSKKKRSGYE